MTQGTIRFQPTYEDVLAGYRLNYRVTVRSGRIARAYLLGTMILGAAGGACWYLGWIDIWMLIAIVAYWPMAFSLILWSVYLRLPRQVRRIYSQQKSLHEETEVEWSAQEIGFRSGRGSSRFGWSDYMAWAENDQVIILRQSEALFNFIPTSALLPQQAADIVSHLARYTGSPLSMTASVPR